MKKQIIYTSAPFGKGLSDEELRKLAYSEGLLHPELFMEFVKKRFPHERDKVYLTEWVERFKSGDPTAYMDNESVMAYIKSIKKLRDII